MNCLVTAPIKSALDANNKNVFLDHWCSAEGQVDDDSCVAELYSDKFKVGSLETQARYHNSLIISRRIISELCPILNQILHLTSPPRYWQIVLGHFIQRYVSTLIYRYDLLKTAVDCFQVTHAYTVEENEDFDLVESTHQSFCLSTLDAVWNNRFNSEILRLSHDVKLLKIPSGIERRTVKEPGLNLFSAGVRYISAILISALQSDRAGVITSSYLPRSSEILLNLKLRQLPTVMNWPNLEMVKVDHGMRRTLKEKIGFSSDPIESLVKSLLPKILPTCFLEGHKQIRFLAKGLKLPKNPNFIFVSNLYENNEVFKVWLAIQAIKGTPYIVGQHGAGYGTHQFLQTDANPEVECSDHFLSWGEMPVGNKSLPAFVLKTCDHAKGEFNKNGYLLLVPPAEPTRVFIWDADREFLKTMESQRSFVSLLPLEVRRRAIIRFAQVESCNRFSQQQHFKSLFPEVSFDKRSTTFRSSASRSRLVVFFYDSTGFLESLSRDVPAIMILPEGLGHLRGDVLTEYEKLFAANLIFCNLQEASSFVVKIWEQVPTWWFSKSTQKIKSRFCKKFCTDVTSPVSFLADTFTQLGR